MKERTRIKFSFAGQEFEGIVVQLGKGEVNIKLDSGYNLVLPETAIVVLAEEECGRKPQEMPPVADDPKLPTLSILHTGGTIASRVDYETGGVRAQFSPEELLSLFPELRGIANIRSRFLRNMWSEDMRFSHYNLLAQEIVREASEGVHGIIITHGTDTMHYTAAALTFMLDNLGVPVLLVGAQRSSDRGSSDGPMNMIAAATFLTKTDFGDIGICMHESESDDWCHVLRGTKCRKMHSSRRDAFRPVNAGPWARVRTDGTVEVVRDDFRKRSDGKPFVKTFLTDLKVGLLKIHPNMSEQEFAAYAGYDGLLLEGTGIGGHVPLTKTDDDTGEHEMIGTAIRHLIDTGTVVAAATQTIYGVVNMRVYSTGRKMLGLGIIGDGCDMHPETAFIKLAWLLSNYPKGEVKRLFEKNLKGEISSVRPLVDSHTE